MRSNSQRDQFIENKIDTMAVCINKSNGLDYDSINANYNPDVRFIPEDLGGAVGNVTWPSSVGSGTVANNRAATNVDPTGMAGGPCLNIDSATELDVTKGALLDLGLNLQGSVGYTMAAVIQDGPTSGFTGVENDYVAGYSTGSTVDPTGVTTNSLLMGNCNDAYSNFNATYSPDFRLDPANLNGVLTIDTVDWTGVTNLTSATTTTGMSVQTNAQGVKYLDMPLNSRWGMATGAPLTYSTGFTLIAVIGNMQYLDTTTWHQFFTMSQSSAFTYSASDKFLLDDIRSPAGMPYSITGDSVSTIVADTFSGKGSGVFSLLAMRCDGTKVDVYVDDFNTILGTNSAPDIATISGVQFFGFNSRIDGGSRNGQMQLNDLCYWNSNLNDTDFGGAMTTLTNYLAAGTASGLCSISQLVPRSWLASNQMDALQVTAVDGSPCCVVWRFNSATNTFTVAFSGAEVQFKSTETVYAEMSTVQIGQVGLAFCNNLARKMGTFKINELIGFQRALSDKEMYNLAMSYNVKYVRQTQYEALVGAC